MTSSMPRKEKKTEGDNNNNNNSQTYNAPRLTPCS